MLLQHELEATRSPRSHIYRPETDSMRRAVWRVVRSPQRRLHLFTALTGVVFVFCCVETPSLTFAELPRAFATDFHARRGFFHVLRWLEGVSSGGDLTGFLNALTGMNAPGTRDDHRAFSRVTPSIQFRSAHELLAMMTTVIQWETYQLVSKAGLQWSLVVFLARAKALTQRVAIACVCCCILSLLCSTIAHSCLRELLHHAVSAAEPPSPTDKATPSPHDMDARAAFMAAFLSTLFFSRLAASIVVNVVLARGYQLYFGGRPERWKDVPRYLGSKRLALSTLFFACAGVGLMAISTQSLRALSEAAAHIESVALAGAFAHFVVTELGLSAEVSPASTGTSNTGDKIKKT